MTNDAAGGTESRAGTREWVALAVLALPTLLLSLDLSVLYLALPHLSADLSPSSTQLLWITDIYGFMIAGFLITMGTLGDRIGRRKLLMIGAAAFGVASTVAAYSTSAEMLIAARALLGIAGATLMPSTLALISNMFRDPKQRSTAIAVWLSCFMVGIAIGPLIGGVLLESFRWGTVFLIGVPVMVVLLVTGPMLLPEYRDAGAGRLDLVSVALSLATILPVIYGIKEMAAHGAEMVTVGTVVIGAIVGVLFILRQNRLIDPLLDLGLFRRRSFSAALGIMLLGGITMGGTYLFGTQYLQIVKELSPLRAGVWLLPSAIATIAGSMLAPSLAQRLRPGNVVAVSMVISTLGFLILTQVETTSALPLTMTALSLIFLGGGLWGALGTDLVVGAAPPEKAGSVSSLSETNAELGGALGVAILGSVGTAVYRNQVADAVSAQAAFTAGLNVVAAIGAVLAIGLALVATALLREVGREGATGEAEQGRVGANDPNVQV